MTSKDGTSSNNGGALQSIPAASRKMVHSLKEIVNCPDAEIYSMLKECNMDPNEAVNRLLSLDPFHKVKSKREKKKETKEVEPKPRGAAGRGGKAGSDRYVGHSGSTHFSSFEQGSLHGKSAYKKENGVNPYIGATPSMPSNSINRQPPTTSNPISMENKVMTAGPVDSYSTSSQHQGYQPAWSGPPGHVSMADIVKMGRPPGKAMNSSQHVSHHYVQAPRSTVSHHDVNLSEYHVTKVSELDHEAGDDAEQHAAPDDDWPIDEHIQADSDLHVMLPTTPSGLHVDMSNSSTNRNNQLPQSQADEVQLADASIENINSTCTGSIRISPARVDEENVANSSLFNNELCSDMGSYQMHRHSFQNHEDEDVEVHVSSVATNMQHLSVEEDQEILHEEENATVIIPDHLQVQSAECSHLSFGSFGSGPYASRTATLKHNMEDASEDVVASPDGHSEARKLEYYDNEPIRTAANENLVHRDGTTAESYEPLSASESPGDLKEAVVLRENHYGYPPSTSSYAFENEQQLNAALAHSQSISQIQNLPQFSSAMQHTYSNSRPNSLLTSNAQATRESDLQYSPFSTTQSMTSKYGNTLPSIGGTTLSMPDMLKAAGFSSNQSAVPGNNLGTGVGPSSVPQQQQHIAVHPYSQPTHPLGPFANMISYPFLPPHHQSYTYMPSAFQQALASNGPYHHHPQSLASLLPQYKNSVSSSSSLPQSASGYPAGFGNSTNIQNNNFSMNPPPASAQGHSNIGYEDLMASLQQQNENSQMWVHGAGSRTMPAVSPNTYYGLTTGQSQQQAAAAAGFRQSQQQQQSSQNYGYQNFYQSQAEMAAMEQQQLQHHHQQQQQHQNPRGGDGLVGSQGQSSSSKQSHQQAWQNIY
ncbi:uncharacterized protein LOC124919161 isoform X2 [Impatiens glandulifera]|uniref:uncharacterized protein LOC124919161 isoform X2 n=1 Tax=Impatiens glandulifera TaxID=253017 RepID=UPI001FB06614|nr:uncharacterized protein LOC124919161 isoform X2 [Impatiens glandulifera]